MVIKVVEVLNVVKVAQCNFYCAQSSMTSSFCSSIVTSANLNDGRIMPYKSGRQIFFVKHFYFNTVVITSKHPHTIVSKRVNIKLFFDLLSCLKKC